MSNLVIEDLENLSLTDILCNNLMKEHFYNKDTMRSLVLSQNIHQCTIR